MDIKYNKIPKVSDQEILKTKNFNNVLKKHAEIKKSYKLLKTIGYLGIASFAGILGYLIYDQSTDNNALNVKETTITKESLPLNPKQNIEITETVPSEEICDDDQTETKQNTSTIENKPKHQVATVEKKSPIEKEVITIQEDSIITSTTQVSNEVSNKNTWFNYAPPTKERLTVLPTIIIAKHSWPEVLSKSALIQAPELNTVYQSVNREVPITRCNVFITQEDATTQPKAYNIKNGTFPPGLIRAIHKAAVNDIILFKNIEVFLPGKGRVEFGDYKIKIGSEKDYNNSLKSKYNIGN